MTTHTHAAPNVTNEPTHEKSELVISKPYSLSGFTNDTCVGDDHPNAAPAANAPPVAILAEKKIQKKKQNKFWHIIERMYLNIYPTIHATEFIGIFALKLIEF